VDRALESPFLDAELPGAGPDPARDWRDSALAGESPFVDAFAPSGERDDGEAEAEDAADHAGDSESLEVEAAEPEGPAEEESEDPPDLPAAVAAALDARDWPLALRVAIRDGFRDHNNLTNRLFFARHPELPAGRLDPAYPRFKALSLEWQKIRDKEVWPAIVAAAENIDLAVPGAQAASMHRQFWTPGGKRFKALVEEAARDVDLNPGLLAAVLLAETSMSAYLARNKVSSYLVGVDDFYESRGTLEARVPAYSKIRWDRKQKPESHPNDAQTNPRTVQTIFFDSGPDALLAVAVYLKFREIRLQEEATKLGKNFHSLGLETCWALIRGAMAAGIQGIRPGLVKALNGEDILIRKNIPPKAYQTYRNATIRTAEALHLSDWIFGIRLRVPAGPQPEVGDAGELDDDAGDGTELEEGEFEEGEIDTRCSRKGHGIIGTDDRRPVRNPLEIPCRFICQLWVRQRDSNGKVTHSGATGLLVSPRHVLTAAHVLISEDTDDRGQWVKTTATEVRVTPARDGGDRPFGTATALLPARIAPGWSPRQKNPGFDYALLTLDTALGEQTFKRLGGKMLGYWGSLGAGGGTTLRAARADALNGRTAITAGYPNDRGGNESPFITRGALSGADARLRHMNITADACEGQSGSPVWLTIDGRHCLVGMMVMVLERTNVALRIGVEVCRQLCLWMKKDSDICAAPAASVPPPGQSEVEGEDSSGAQRCRCRHGSALETERDGPDGGGGATTPGWFDELEEEHDPSPGNDLEAFGAVEPERENENENELEDEDESDIDEEADPDSEGAGLEAYAEGEGGRDPALRDLAERIFAREAGAGWEEEQVPTRKWTNCFTRADVERVRKVYRDNDAAAAANDLPLINQRY
jgi:V8-like Glu-specific endopeptidase